MNLISLSLVIVLSQISFGNQDYILNSQKCKIPNIKPFNPEVQNLMKPHSYVSCNHSELLTFIEKTENSAILHLREHLFSKYSSNNFSCCYSYVTRNGSFEEPDVGIAISECWEFSKTVTLEEDIVKVVCSIKNETENSTEIIYENVHNPVLINDKVKGKIQNDDKNFLSVLLVVVDSISRLNFIRTMPETYKFFINNKFIEMKGYTKTGENTYPNFMSLLTGLNLHSMYTKCKPTKVGSLDTCPMIWYDYKNHNFITAYAEDHAQISTFNYLKKGFLNPPTDYYFKPYIEASEILQIQYKSGMPYCTGPETTGERILNLAKDFSTTFQNQTTFGIFWMNTFSHDDLNAPYAMDVKMRDFFKYLKNTGILDEKIVIFLSDHGIRYGEIRKTQSGWFEQRMPTSIVRVPKKFKQQYREEYKNLKANSNKLTSTYDLYATLQHILRLSRPSYTKTDTPACANCTSFFKKIPEDRECEDAGIPPEWCTCSGQFSGIDVNHEFVQNLTNLAIEKINDLTYPLGKCDYVRLNFVESASISEFYGDGIKNVFIVFHTKPEAIFLTTVKIRQTPVSKSDIYLRRITNYDFCLREVKQRKNNFG